MEEFTPMDRETDYIDDEGYRANVGIVIMNDDRRVFLGGRARARGWQFPQGGIRRGERARRRCTGNSPRKSACGPGRSRRSRARAAGCATGCRRNSSAATRVRCASARSSAGSCCASAPKTRRSSSTRPRFRRNSTAGAGPAGGKRFTTSSISSAACIPARCTNSVPMRFRKACRPIRTGGRSA